LIEINTKYSEWLHSLTTLALAYYSYDNYDSLKDKDLYFNEKQLAYKVAEDNLHLFVHDSELLDKKNALVQVTFKLHASTLTHITQFISNCQIYNDIKAKAAEQDQLELNGEYHRKQQVVIDSSLQDANAIQLDIISKQIEFIKLLNYKIY
jgi:hypothetical protein